jgi:hypothetical protein
MRLFDSFCRRARKAHGFALLCAVAFALVSPRALAAAPMCDPSGASVVAPIPVLPNATGVLNAPKSCHDPLHDDGIDVSRSGSHKPLAQRSLQAPDLVIVVPATFATPSGVKLGRPLASEMPALPGVSNLVYRPPRQ